MPYYKSTNKRSATPISDAAKYFSTKRNENQLQGYSSSFKNEKSEVKATRRE
ncbi:MAG: hypothetical protein KTR26_05035 [Flammeovirgaceae bacterium]|nr:hypothetical protein [Flammeovirgaceae bacterium]